MPVLVDDYDDPTPVETPSGQPRRRRVTVQTFAEDTKLELRDLRNRLNNAGLAAFNMRAELVERLIKLETRFEHVIALGGQVEDLQALAVELAAFKAALWGHDGKNGKLGDLRKGVADAQIAAERAPKHVRWMLGLALGSVLGSIIPAGFFVKTAVEESAAERAVLHAEISAAKAERGVIQSQVLLLFKLVNINRTAGDP